MCLGLFNCHCSTCYCNIGLKTIESSLFYGCSSLESVTIPKGVTNIYSEAFFDCSSLKSISFPSSLENLGWWTFCGCISLRIVTIPKGVTGLADGVFFGCNNLKGITIPKSIKYIDSCGLGYGTNTKEDSVDGYRSWKIPGFTIKGYTDTVAERYAQDHGFKFIPLDSTTAREKTTTTARKPATTTTEKPATQSADTTVLVGSIQTVNGSKYRVTSDNTVTYGMPVSKAVQVVSIPSTITINGKAYTVTAIMPRAFAGCKKLKAVLIPATIKIIGTKAFFKCKKLKRIYIRTALLTKPTVGKAAFKKVNKKAKFYVPKARKKAYKKILKKRGMTGSMKVK